MQYDKIQVEGAYLLPGASIKSSCRNIKYENITFRTTASREPMQIARGFAIIWQIHTKTSSLTFATLLLASGFLVVIWKCVECLLYFRDAARISKLYKGLSCTEISVETGDSCNGPKGYCVIPSTPGTLEKACPIQTPRAIRRSLKARKAGRHKRAETKQRKNNGGRLVGASALHTYSKRDPPLRYPWICSLKTRGFR